MKKRIIAATMVLATAFANLTANAYTEKDKEIWDLRFSGVDYDARTPIDPRAFERKNPDLNCVFQVCIGERNEYIFANENAEYLIATIQPLKDNNIYVGFFHFFDDVEYECGDASYINKDGKRVINYSSELDIDANTIRIDYTGWSFVKCDLPIFMYEDVEKLDPYHRGEATLADLDAAHIEAIYDPRTEKSSFDIEDAVRVVNHVNGNFAITGEDAIRLDVNKDGVIAIDDAVMIVNHVNGVKAIEC